MQSWFSGCCGAHVSEQVYPHHETHQMRNVHGFIFLIDKRRDLNVFRDLMLKIVMDRDRKPCVCLLLTVNDEGIFALWEACSTGRSHVFYPYNRDVRSIYLSSVSNTVISFLASYGLRMSASTLITIPYLARQQHRFVSDFLSETIDHFVETLSLSHLILMTSLEDDCDNCLIQDIKIFLKYQETILGSLLSSRITHGQILSCECLLKGEYDFWKDMLDQPDLLSKSPQPLLDEDDSSIPPLEVKSNIVEYSSDREVRNESREEEQYPIRLLHSVGRDRGRLMLNTESAHLMPDSFHLLDADPKDLDMKFAFDSTFLSKQVRSDTAPLRALSLDEPSLTPR